MSGIEISLVRPEEHDEVDRVVTTAYEHDYGPRDHSGDPFYRTATRVEVADVWVARDAESGAILGSLTTPPEGGDRMLEDTLEGELEFRLLAVAPAARRRGVGAALTSFVVGLARERGYRAVFMKSGPHMTGAHALYEGLGFRRDVERDGLIVGGVKQFDLYAFVLDVDASADAVAAEGSVGA